MAETNRDASEPWEGMMRRCRFALTAFVTIAIATSSVVLSSCGGGSTLVPDVVLTPSASRIPEIVITPAANRAPRAEGAIPAQTLTAGVNAPAVDVTPYFRDPDNDGLTYSATSNRPGIVTAGMSGGTLTLAPVSAGTATVTVAASDGDAGATQTVATTVREPENGGSAGTTRPPSTTEPEPENGGSAGTTRPPSTTEPEPENGLTGLRVDLQRTQGRETRMRMTLEPAGAAWSRINFDIDPADAGGMCCYQSFAESIYFRFTCSDDYNGNSTITILVSQPNGPTVDESVAFTCR